ncbi:hypothetical protein Tco_1082075 [Tanacetum coccineum]|uniref:Uncharacterized protein n=1 Tax=Tanacetum coccineum TaxID=301880 RepID=A0ABQ5HZP5_9ASTR
MSTEVHQAAEIVTTSNELDLLFDPLFDEYFNGEHQVVLKSSAGKMPTKIELTLEQSQQGVSNDVLDEDDVLETPALTASVTPPSAKGKEVASSASVEAGNRDHQSDMSVGFVGSNGNGKHTVIDLDEYDEEAAATNRAKKQLVTVKIEKP